MVEYPEIKDLSFYVQNYIDSVLKPKYDLKELLEIFPQYEIKDYYETLTEQENQMFPLTPEN